MKRNYSTLFLLIFLLITRLNAKGQDVRFVADIQVAGIGFKWQDVQLGSHTTTENVTGMSGLSIGANIPIVYNFEANVTAGFLCKLGFSSNTSYSSSGSSTSSESTTFFVPKVGLGLSRTFVFSDKKFVQGFRLGGGVEHYWPGKLKFKRDGDYLYINYNDNSGYFCRAGLVIRKFGEFQLIPNLTYRNFTLEATNYSNSTSNSLHSSLQTLQVRNIEIGIILLYGGN